MRKHLIGFALFMVLVSSIACGVAGSVPPPATPAPTPEPVATHRSSIYFSIEPGETYTLRGSDGSYKTLNVIETSDGWEAYWQDQPFEESACTLYKGIMITQNSDDQKCTSDGVNSFFTLYGSWVLVE